MESVGSTFLSTLQSCFSFYGLNKLSSGFPSYLMMKRFYQRPGAVFEKSTLSNRQQFSNLLQGKDKIFFISLSSLKDIVQCTDLLDNLIENRLSYSGEWNALLKKYDFTQLNDWTFCLLVECEPEWDQVAKVRQEILGTNGFFPIGMPAKDLTKFNFLSDLLACSIFPEDFNSTDICFASGCPTPLLMHCSDIWETLTCAKQISQPSQYIGIDEDINPTVVYTTGNDDIILRISPDNRIMSDLNQHAVTSNKRFPLVVDATASTFPQLESALSQNLCRREIIGFHVQLSSDSIPATLPSTQCSGDSLTEVSVSFSNNHDIVPKNNHKSWFKSLFGLTVEEAPEDTTTERTSSTLEPLEEFLSLLFRLNDLTKKQGSFT